MRKWHGALALAALLGLAGAVEAQTVAYWRFEELPAGQEFPAPTTNGGPDSGLAADSSGNGNTLRTFAGFSNPVYSGSVAGPVVNGAANNTSLDFSPNEDLYTTTPNTLNAKVLNQFTLEASFNVNNVTRYHALVGKDSKPLATSPLAPLQLKVRDDSDKLQIEILDAAGNAAQVQSINPITPGQWYQAAAVNDGMNLSLYLNSGDGAGYVLQGSVPVTGGLYNNDATWTVGRGFFNNNITDWTDGLIDEVRISDVALSPSQFLVAVPEPGALGLLGLGGLLALRRRR
jgi:hypothetical protein